jgi:predicted nucleic acid-binding protein
VTDDVLIDNSAWSHIVQRSISQERLAVFADAIREGRIYVSLPFLLEAGYSARSGADHAQLMAELGALPLAPLDAQVASLTLTAQAELAASGHHRLPPVDLMIAALASRHGLGVLHYDADYDRISTRSALSFESVWLAPQGSL